MCVCVCVCVCARARERTCVCGGHSVVSDSCDSMDCCPPGSSVHGILQTRILEWVAISLELNKAQIIQGPLRSIQKCNESMMPA